MSVPSSPVSLPTDWIEVFHSKPSMAHCYLLEKLPSALFTSPSPHNELVDASHVRAGFRVFRLPARRIEFAITNGTARNWEDNHGANYVIDSVPGRYVIEHGIRRVGDAHPAECIQAALRSNDEFVQVHFRADLWERCFCAYKADNDPWTPAPGVEMKRLESNAGADGKRFQIEVKATTFQCAFNDGAAIWDSNLRQNYKIGNPGKYAVTDGNVLYVSPADKDADKPVAQPMPAPTVADDPVLADAPQPPVGLAH